MASGFYLIEFRRFSASFTGIIGRVVGFGGVGRVDSTADDNILHMSSKYIRRGHSLLLYAIVCGRVCGSRTSGRHLSITFVY